MSKHTPGPWAVDPRGGGTVYAQVNGLQRQVALATGNAPMHQDEADGTTHEIQMANARLIAAAPDLLIALVALKREASLCGGSVFEYMQGYLEDADLAIQKATEG